MPEEVPFVVKHLDTVGPVVADEDLLSVIDNNPIGELQVLWAPKLIQHIAKLVKDDDAHNLEKDIKMYSDLNEKYAIFVCIVCYFSLI